MIEPYDHGTHIARLTAWLGKHGISVPDRRLFSDLGFVVDNAALGFLFLTNSKQAYIDHVAANPDVPVEKRDLALTELFEKLESLAREKGVLLVTALASLPTMKRRFEGRGYKVHGTHGMFSLYYKTLEGGI